MLLPAPRHELSFWHGGHRLAGDLVLPAAGGRAPVVLVVREPELPDRDRSAWLDGLAEAGVAAFTWDRPEPSGPSGQPGPFEDPVRRIARQAREVLAALDRVRCRPEVDPDAVALVGWGEGGLAAAQAATFSSRVRALVLAGAPTVAPVRLVEHRLLERLREGGFGPDDVEAARSVVRCRLDALVTGYGQAEADARAASSRTRPWYEFLRGLDDFSAPPLPTLLADPLPTLSAVRAPVLALFGELDTTLPLWACVDRARGTLRAAGHEDHRVAVVRGADHALRVRPGHGLGRLSGGRHQFGEWPPTLTAMIVEWLDRRIRDCVDVPGFVPPIGPEDRVDALARSCRPTAGPGWEECSLLPVRQIRRRISH